MNAGKNSTDKPSAPPRISRLLGFIAELRRRHVCRAATGYCVALWLVCQIVEVVYTEWGLPDWTLKLVIVIGLAGLPLVLILSWVGDLTRDGFVPDRGLDRTSTEARRPLDCVIDCGLLVIAVVIGAQLGLSTIGAASDEVPLSTKTLAVAPFVIASHEAELVSQRLLADLRYALTTEADVVVIIPRDQGTSANGLTLGGTVTVSGELVCVTVTIIDDRSRELIWTKVFQQSPVTDVTLTKRLAKEIVAAVSTIVPTKRAGEDHAR